jgi:hypothetical protein
MMAILVSDPAYALYSATSGGPSFVSSSFAGSMSVSPRRARIDRLELPGRHPISIQAFGSLRPIAARAVGGGNIRIGGSVLLD